MSNANLILWPSFGASFSVKMTIVLVLSLIGNLFFVYAPIGWTAGVFGLLALAAIAVIRRPEKCAYLTICLSVALCLSLVDQPTALKALILWLLLSSITLQTRPAGTIGIIDDPIRTLKQAVFGWLSVIPISSALRHVRHRRQEARPITKLQYYYLPALFLVLFVSLIRIANPVFELSLSNIDTAWLRNMFDPVRVTFFLILFALILGVVRPSIQFIGSRSRRPKLDAGLAKSASFFSRASLTVSLLVFNALFAYQNILDVIFLWSGAALPENMTYAEYAHRGAYPLILTTLLAAVFVLLASQSRRSGLASILTLAWLVQNVFLAASAMFRTLVYIDVYALTLLRLSALIWMAAVAIGLALLFIKTWQDRSVEWLLHRNLMTVFTILYLCSLIDLTSVVAHYNVRHAKELRGTGIAIDLAYLEKLGPSSLPALVWMEEKKLDYHTRRRLRTAISNLEAKVESQQSDWRGWTFKNSRLKRALDQRASVDS